MPDQAQDYFLAVRKSLSGRAWRAREHSERTAQAISQQQNLPELLGRVLAGRSVLPESAADFLSPSLRNSMPDPSSLRDMGLSLIHI